MLDIPKVRVDATTYQRPLAELSETLAQKVYREGLPVIGGPVYVVNDLFVLMRYALSAYNFFAYLHADVRLAEDPYWRPEYTTLSLGSVRTMIDCLFNLVFILQDPARNGTQFRLTGFRRKLKNLENDKKLYGDRPEWKAHLRDTAKSLRLNIRQHGFDPDALPKDTFKWPTLGIFLGDRLETDNNLKKFLRTLTLGSWREYSQVLHASFDGLVGHSSFLVRDTMPHERRHEAMDSYPFFMSMHAFRAALILHSINCEVQARWQFRDALIDERVRNVWLALQPIYEAKEFLAVRYDRLMRDRNFGNWP